MDKFTIIITDMIQFALSWEEVHGVPQCDRHEIQPEKPLTILTSVDTLDSLENLFLGDDDGYRNNSKKLSAD